MSIFKRLWEIIKNVFGNNTQSKMLELGDGSQTEQISEEELQKKIFEENQKKIEHIFKDTPMQVISDIRLSLARIELTSKTEFNKFTTRLNTLENKVIEEYQAYVDSIDISKLSFTCDPEANAHLKAQIDILKSEVDTYIAKVGVYKILLERFDTMLSILEKGYSDVVSLNFKQDLKSYITSAKEKLDELLIRNLGSVEINQIFDSKFDRRTLNSRYFNIKYLIFKLELRYALSTNLNIDTVLSNFEDEMLPFVLSDLNSLQDLLESTQDETIKARYYKIKSLKLTSDAIKTSKYMLDILKFEDVEPYLLKKALTDDVKSRQVNILKDILAVKSSTK